jgi:hypothetical protein
MMDFSPVGIPSREQFFLLKTKALCTAKTTTVPYSTKTSVTMNNSIDCLRETPMNPPTDGVACAIPIGGNLTSILSSCCQTTSITTYAAPGLNNPTCFQYCNVPAGLNYQAVSDCIVKSPGNLGVTVSCSAGKAAKSAASTHHASKLALGALGILITSAVFGADIVL